MKIIKGDKVWVQKYNIASLLDALSDLKIPIGNEVCNAIWGDAFTATSEDMFEFVELSGPEVVKFFESLDFVVNYNDLKDKGEAEVLSFGQSVQEDVIDKTSKTKSSKVQQQLSHAAFLKMYDIRNYLWYLQGSITFKIPTVCEEEVIEVTSVETPQRESGFRRLLRSIRRGNKRGGLQ